MNDEFEKILDEALRKWPEEVGHYTWEQTLSSDFAPKWKLHIIGRLIEDQLMKQSNSGTIARYFLTPKGHNVKRHIDTLGYVAQLNGKVEHKMYYHIKIIKKDGAGECSIDHSEKDLIDRFVTPYLAGKDILINGTVVKFNEIKRIKIAESKVLLEPHVKEKQLVESMPFVKDVPKTSVKWRFIDLESDVTNRYINKFPATKKVNAFDTASLPPQSHFYSLAIDVVGYSKLNTDVQHKIVQH